MAVFSKPEIEYIQKHKGKMSSCAIAVNIGKNFGVYRTRAAVATKITQLREDAVIDSPPRGDLIVQLPGRVVLSSRDIIRAMNNLDMSISAVVRKLVDLEACRPSNLVLSNSVMLSIVRYGAPKKYAQRLRIILKLTGGVK
ncbi:hypothetical protein [Paremcibacter congregatus]|uniref:hypothetical protein n=1 Tax=Paremcibacter congregatus TaxID=2043170 RepID=UPI0030EEDBD2|tara:strand:- start:13 stop:435 length:423 start_codon:yes stop_codon:yes gene_type:complete